MGPKNPQNPKTESMEPHEENIEAQQETSEPSPSFQAATIPHGHKIPSKKEVLDRLELALAEKNKDLKWKEKLKIAYVLDKMDLAYYRMWNDDANRLFHRCVINKQRAKAIRAGKFL